jgi:hypothetical protein
MITGIRTMKMVKVISEDSDFYFCQEVGCYPAGTLTLSKKEVNENPDDYVIQRWKPLHILVREESL